MRVQEAVPPASRPALRTPLAWPAVLIGIVLGVLGSIFLGVAFVGPAIVSHRNDLPFERLYGDFAVGAASRVSAGSQPNPVADNRQALNAGREAYIGSCGVCHGATGDGQGAFGQATYPPATDLRAHDTQEKTDAQLFWVIKNGLSFTGMPGFGGQYSNRDIWSLVSYVRAMGAGSASPVAVPTATSDQLAQALPLGDTAQRGAAVYFAQGCAGCHGPVGDAPGNLGLRAGERELNEAVRRGRPGMPAYGTDQLSDTDLQNIQAYMATFPNRGRGGAPAGSTGGGGREGGERDRGGRTTP